MTAEDRAQTLTFLFKIIDDNQATIRFLDTKAAFGIAVLGAMLGKILDRAQLIACGSHGVVVTVISVIFALLVIASAILGYKTVFPTINPAQNVSLPGDLEPKFFISEFRPRRFLRLLSSDKRFAMLDITHTSYCAALKQATSENLESIAAAEVLKLSFIRQLKMDRLAAFANVLIATVILFVIVVFAAPKPVAEKQAQAPHESPPVFALQAPREVYHCAPGRVKPKQ